ncbi:MAG: ferric reductase-like transmembrane domain-containing protein [Polyangiaceae bacterium]
MSVTLRGAFWIGVYVFVAVAPLIFTGLGISQPGQGWVRDFSVALGFVGLAMMTLQFALIARFEGVAAPFGMDAVLQYHRQIAYVATAFVITHPVLLFVDDPRKLRLLDFTTAPNRARFAVSATVALLLLMATSIWRRQMRLRYELWQLLHGLLAVAIVALALAHAAGVGYYVARPWQRALWMAMSAALVGLLGWVRVLKPLWRYRHPWRVESIHAEHGNAWTMVMRPEGHPGFRFQPGQFAWVMVGGAPVARTPHPVARAARAEDGERVAMTIKARGDFTGTIAKVQPGTRVYLDGPHGVFSPDRFEGPGFVLIAGGVGITPIISMVRTMADRQDPRPCLLLYANRDWDGVTFRDELDELARRTPLTVVHVLEKAPAGWQGETGYITEAVLRRHLPKRFERMQYFVCGPGPMMDAMDLALCKVGVSAERINTERFDMV